MASNERQSSPGRYTHSVLIALGSALLLWSAWLWIKLIGARGGDAAECAIGGGQICSSVWDSAFANAVQDATLVPVAGWGVIWALVALILPVSARMSAAAERWWDALVIHSAVGLAGVLILAAAMFTQGAFCSDCAVAYGLTIGYAWQALRHARPLGAGSLLPAAGRALAATAIAWVLVLYPSSHTPSSPRAEALEALRGLQVPADGPETDRQLASFLKQLDADQLQDLADMIATWEAAPEVPVRPARALIGPRGARVRVTEFADALCGHCAQLHELLASLREKLPPGSFAVEPRHFPLDPACNPELGGRSQHPVRCTAARVLICSERQPWAFELAGEIFAQQRDLDEERLWRLVERHGPRAAIESCASSEVTRARLRDDVAWAVEHGIQGTPLVLLDGRRAPAQPNFLIAMLLAGSDPDHPMLRDLPPGRVRQD